ncbi:MAG: hypothetical protein HFG05_00960 [Oscillibacter sp.]|nr:hypothetical protein [Oscillibacter sp.]
MLTTFATLAVCSGCATVRRYLDRSSRRETDHFGGRVRLRVLRNRGAAFGLPIPALPLASGAALELLWWRRKRCPLGTGLILGGGLSNLLERLQEGEVYDYLQFPKAPRPLNRYVFNLADLCIATGGALCLFRGKRSPGLGNVSSRGSSWGRGVLR